MRSINKRGVWGNKDILLWIIVLRRWWQLSFPFKAIGGVWGQKYKLMLFKSTFYHEFNAFYGNVKFKPILDLWASKCLECDPFWAIKRQFWGLFWAIKPEIFAFKWPNIPNYNTPITLSDKMKKSHFQGQNFEKIVIFSQISCFLDKIRFYRKSLKSLRMWGKYIGRLLSSISIVFILQHYHYQI